MMHIEIDVYFALLCPFRMLCYCVKAAEHFVILPLHGNLSIERQYLSPTRPAMAVATNTKLSVFCFY